mgnify:CR=1 FL=1
MMTGRSAVSLRVRNFDYVRAARALHPRDLQGEAPVRGVGRAVQDPVALDQIVGQQLGGDPLDDCLHPIHHPDPAAERELLAKTLRGSIRALVEILEAAGAEVLHHAVELATYAGYTNIGTFEFLLDAERGTLAFIEANARLQVELVVDDEDRLLKMLRRTLTYEGFDVVTATNGYDALVQFEARRPDVIGVTMMSVDFGPAMQCIDLVKEIDPRMVTVVGGPHPTLALDEVKFCDTTPSGAASISAFRQLSPFVGHVPAMYSPRLSSRSPSLSTHGRGAGRGVPSEENPSGPSPDADSLVTR